MSGPNAASVAGRDTNRLTIEHTRTQPGERTLLGCPACGSPDALVTREQVIAERPIESAWDVQVSAPELDQCEWDDPAVVVDDTQRIKLLAVRCDTCHWMYQGPEPLGRLTPTKEQP